MSDSKSKTGTETVVHDIVHTPGPWTVCDEDRLGINADGESYSIVIYGNDADDPEIGIQGRTPQERKANARLIAAAPELLLACKLMLEHEGEAVTNGVGMECDSDELEHAKDLAKAAIAKATGVCKSNKF
jgi:hypothetical protein